MYLREKDGHSKNTEDYFLAGKSLPWWAIGASLIAANISAEQIIGMSGEGFRIGLAIAAYEWQAAIVLILVAKYFLPIFLETRNLYNATVFRNAIRIRCEDLDVRILDISIYGSKPNNCSMVGRTRCEYISQVFRY